MKKEPDMATGPPDCEPAVDSSTHGAYVQLSLCLLRNYNAIRLLVVARMGPQVLDWENVDDIVQDVVLESLQHAEGFRYQGEAAFMRWISTVTRRVVGKALQRSRREPPALSIQNAQPADDIVRPSRVPGDDPTPSSFASHEEQCRRLLVALASMRHSDRAVIRMVQLEERSLADVGTKLGCSPKAAGMRFARAVRRLNAEVGPCSHAITG
jgi:RNA polymerase sigma-70 factor (ECF subfamily)